ncbi:ribonuclease H-like domain-containing protein [Rhizophagus irregularis DAOM 181602=DAOM 197198]|nr:ribonuclease H-like domain-containing protein [Rhizophagus irregularis DAOM 181602=DAOM 197198]
MQFNYLTYIWEDINKGKAVSSGKFAASCKYCKNTWSRSEVSKLEEHLSNHCPESPAAVVRRVVEHPFSINFIKELNAGTTVLVNQLLERELAQVNFKVNSELEKEMNLTLAFDGWTSSTHRSIWNFIVITLSRKEYLYQLSDLSENSHTTEYLVTNHPKIENV